MQTFLKNAVNIFCDLLFLNLDLIQCTYNDYLSHVLYFQATT